MVRRPAADGQGRRLHLQPDPEGHLRADQLRQLREQPQDGHRPGRHHPGHDDQGAQPDHAAAGRADPARAHLEGHRRQEGVDLRQREERGRLGPVQAGGAQHRPVRAAVGQQVLLGRRAQDRRGRLPGLQQRRRPAPGAQEGRDRLRRRARPGAVQLPQEHRGHHRRGRRLLRLRRAGLQHRGRPGQRRADRRRPPGPQGQAGPPGDRPRHRQAGPGPAGPWRLRDPGERGHPLPVRQPDLPAARRRGLRLRPGRGQPAARRGRLQGRRRRQGPGDARRRPAAALPAGRPPGVQHLQQSVQFMQGWLRDIGIATEVKVVEENRLTEIIGQGEFDMFEWGWVVEPDPDYQLSTFTCGSRSYKQGGDVLANLSDSFYCNPAYDKLYEQQKVTIDPAKRAEVVKQMQKMLYDDAPYVVTFYYDELQAYRSDRFAGFRPQPDPGGVVLFGYGTYSYLNITTPQAAAAGDDDGGSGVPLILIGGAVAVLGAAGVMLALRRRSTQDERE